MVDGGRGKADMWLISRNRHQASVMSKQTHCFAMSMLDLPTAPIKTLEQIELLNRGGPCQLYKMN